MSIRKEGDNPGISLVFEEGITSRRNLEVLLCAQCAAELLCKPVWKGLLLCSCSGQTMAAAIFLTRQAPDLPLLMACHKFLLFM